jgi:exodeoxyribonuclease VII large subunit
VNEPRTFTVTELTRNIRFLLEENFSKIWVEGEVTNFKFHTSGHMYFSLKDAEAQLGCVMFRDANRNLGFELKEGLKILCCGRISVYPVRGQYQLYVEKAEPKGVGALQLRFEELKEKLRKEGLFETARKKEIPYLPARIGVVTSIDGAALRDILNVLERRFSNVHILIYPVAVQGAAAAPLIAEAIEDLNRWEAADVLIVGRGGGSLEDLWAFNEEITARAIFNSRIPVISAVGHEVDFTIADFVADLRAATPSAAAEMVLPRREELILRVNELKSRALGAFIGKIKSLRQELITLQESQGLQNPLLIFETRFQRLDELKKNLVLLFSNFVTLKKEKLSAAIGKLEALGPLATLKRGFSVSLRLPEEIVVTSASELKVGDRVRTRLSHGSFVGKVEEILEGNT